MTYFLEHDILDTHRNVGNCSQEYVGVPRARRAVVKEKGEKENRQNGARIRESGLHAMLGALEAEHGLLLAAPLALAACAARADGGSPGAEARSATLAWWAAQVQSCLMGMGQMKQQLPATFSKYQRLLSIQIFVF